MHRLQQLDRQTPTQLDHAYATCLHMVRRAPEDAHPHLLMGLACWVRGDAEAALRAIRTALVLQPDHAEGFGHYGQMLAIRRETGEALVLFRRALLVRPWNEGILYRMGVGLAEAGEITGAAGAYLLAVVCRPDHGEALNNLGVIAKDMGNFERGRHLVPAIPGRFARLFAGP